MSSDSSESNDDEDYDMSYRKSVEHKKVGEVYQSQSKPVREPKIILQEAKRSSQDHIRRNVSNRDTDKDVIRDTSSILSNIAQLSNSELNRDFSLYGSFSPLHMPLESELNIPPDKIQKNDFEDFNSCILKSPSLNSRHLSNRGHNRQMSPSFTSSSSSSMIQSLQDSRTNNMYPSDIAGHPIELIGNSYYLKNKFICKPKCSSLKSGKKEGNRKSAKVEGHPGQKIKNLIDSTELFDQNDSSKLYRNFKKYGYIYIRERIPEKAVNEAYQSISKHLQLIEEEFCSDNADVYDSKYDVYNTVDVFEGDVIGSKYASSSSSSSSSSASASAKDQVFNKMLKSIGQFKSFQVILNHKVIAQALALLASGKAQQDQLAHDVLTFDEQYVWLRVKRQGECTAEHADVFNFRVRKIVSLS